MPLKDIGRITLENSKISVKRRPFTLMEMMVVLTIISMITAAGTVAIGRLLSDQRYRSSVARVEELLQVAQDVMILYGNDVDVVLESGVDGLKMELRGLIKKIPPPLSRYFILHHIPGIGSVRFLEDGGIVKSDKITLEFYASGSTLSRGLLELTAPNGSLKDSIAFYGYPHKFLSTKSSSIPKDQEESEKTSQILYPEEIAVDA